MTARCSQTILRQRARPRRSTTRLRKDSDNRASSRPRALGLPHPARLHRCQRTNARSTAPGPSIVSRRPSRSTASIRPRTLDPGCSSVRNVRSPAKSQWDRSTTPRPRTRWQVRCPSPLRARRISPGSGGVAARRARTRSPSQINGSMHAPRISTHTSNAPASTVWASAVRVPWRSVDRGSSNVSSSMVPQLSSRPCPSRGAKDAVSDPKPIDRRNCRVVLLSARGRVCTGDH